VRVREGGKYGRRKKQGKVSKKGERERAEGEKGCWRQTQAKKRLEGNMARRVLDNESGRDLCQIRHQDKVIYRTMGRNDLSKSEKSKGPGDDG